ncbi:MAG: TIGR04255 family protein [Pirellulales bacterium]
MVVPDFRISVDEKFPALDHAPIVEAVIAFNAPPSIPFDQQRLREDLVKGFVGCEINEQMQHETGIRSDSDGKVEMLHRFQWDGYSVTSGDTKYICQWKRNGLAVSRLQPYESWERLLDVVMAFWGLYRDLGKPEIVESIGVRFISQIPLKSDEPPSKFIPHAISPLKNLGLLSESFIHQDTIPLKGYPYELRLIRAMQPAAEKSGSKRMLIVDIDVSTIVAVSFDEIGMKLDELRYIKNKVFFSVMKDAGKRFK